MVKRIHQSVRKKRVDAKKRLYWIGGVTGAVIVLLVIVLLVIVYTSTSPVDNDPVIIPTEKVTREITNENTAGDPEAPVKVEVYSNYQCSHCKTFSEEVEPEIVEKYINTGKVYLVHNATSYQGSKSAQAAYCAMDQNKFWQYHDILFANQTNAEINGIADENLSLFAEKLGMDVKQFNQCIDSDKYGEKIQQIGEEGYEKGITGTPMFIVNGELVSSYHSVIETIEQKLAELE